MALSIWGGSRRRKEKERERREEEQERKARERKRQDEQEELTRKESLKMNAEKIREEEKRSEKEKKEEEDRRLGLLLSEIDHENTTFAQTYPVMGLADRLESHPSGKAFRDAIISGRPPKDRERNIAKLRYFHADNDNAVLTLNDIPPVEISDKCFMFSMNEALTQEEFKSLKPYILVSDIFIHYIPMDTFLAVSHPVTFNICDFRRTNNEIVRGYSLTHTAGANILFTLDYCVSKKDLNKLCLSVTSSLDSFRPGTQWAAAKVVVSMSHMDFPVKSNLQKTMGVIHMSDSDLHDYITDPRFSDGVITPKTMQLLKDAYKRGEIEDSTKHTDDKMEINVAQTNVGENDGNTEVVDIMRNIREAHLKKERENAMASSKMTPRSALKKSSVPSSSKDDKYRSPSVNSDNEENDPTWSSRSSQTEETFKIDQRKDKGPSSLRAVNWGAK